MMMMVVLFQINADKMFDQLEPYNWPEELYCRPNMTAETASPEVTVVRESDMN